MRAPHRIGLGSVLLFSTLPTNSFGSINVWVSFGGGWVTELDQAMGDAGVAPFTPSERAMIEANIFSHLQSIYAGYAVTFSLTDPGGTRDVIDFNVNENVAPAGTLGFAPLQPTNFATGQITNVLPRNFSFSIESGDSRSDMITEISRSFSGTAAHELGHSIGLQHHHAYADPGITPANYSNTGGLQNQYIMATGPTGLSEQGRESPRTFNVWERAQFDIATSELFGGTSAPLVTNPVSPLFENGDIPETVGAALNVPFQTGQTSGLNLSVILADFDNTNDIDLYALTFPTPGFLTAEIFSDSLFVAAIDGTLRLLGVDGSTVLAFADGTYYSGNAFGSGNAPRMENDPFLLNIPIAAAGTYYLQVGAVSSESVGDDYVLVAGFAPVPEPTLACLLAVTATALLRRRAQHR